MKPIKLTLQAFESYAARCEIDFARLTSSGVYLIDGDTGSGKTTLFDAISYALFGACSNTDRKDDAFLKTSFLTPEKESYVDLLFEEKGKRYEVVRKPAQDYFRARKSSDPSLVTRKPMSVKLSFPSDPESPALIGKEATEKIQELIGFDRDQFSQVVMLAQGDFDRILSEQTTGRRQILRKIFATQIFNDLGATISSEFKKISEDIEKKKEAVDHTYSMITYPDEEMRDKALSVSGEKERVLFLEEAGEEASRLLLLLDARKKETEKKKESLTRESEKQKTYLDNLKKKKEKETEKEEVDRRLLALKKKKQELEADLPEREENASRAISLKDKMQEYTSLDALRTEIEDKDKESRKTKKEKADTSSSLHSYERNLAEIKAKIQEEEEELKKEVDSSLELDRLSSRLLALSDLQKKIQELQKKQVTLEEKKKEEIEAANKTKTAEEAYRSGQQAYFGSTAFELSKRLEENKPCPVCGSLSHPCPAKKREDFLSREEYLTLQEQYQTAEKSEQETSSAFNAIDGEVQQRDKEIKDTFSSLLLAVDNPPSYLAKVLEETTKSNQEKIRLEKEKDYFASLKKDKENNRKKQEELEKTIQEEQKKLEVLSATDASLDSLLLFLQKQEEEKAGKLSYKTKEEALSALKNLNDAVDSYDLAVKSNSTSLEQESGNSQSLSGEIQTLSSSVDSYKGRDADTLDSEEEVNFNEQQQEEKEKTLLDQSQGSIEKGLADLQEFLKENEKSEKQFNMLSHLSRVFDANNQAGDGEEGRGISLEAYVLSYYLDQILVLASDRFKVMSNGRYVLLRKKVEQDKGNGQQGLDIDVLDLINGKARPASSLSGGEKFMASMSLALGLSDYVRNKRGQMHIDALFIDEGFGTLDEETLAVVSQVLRDLSSQEGTSVGLISHVEELRDAIPVQLRVVKNRNGESTATIKED